MKTGFSVTYERWTYDDIEHGDTDDRGFVVENVSLRDALSELADRPEYALATECDEYPIRAPRWFCFDKWNDGTREYYEQGITEDRALHVPDHITSASRRRIARLLGVLKA